MTRSAPPALMDVLISVILMVSLPPTTLLSSVGFLCRGVIYGMGETVVNAEIQSVIGYSSGYRAYSFIRVYLVSCNPVTADRYGVIGVMVHFRAHFPRLVWS
ncbi:MAG: hypothetical protein ACYCXG_09560 [Acidiferrobacter sp.]